MDIESLCRNRGAENFTFYRFPERHWKHIRTSNVLERAFKEVKRRTKVVGRFPTETSALMMVFGILEEKRMIWQKVRMKAEDIAWIEEVVKSLEPDGADIKGYLQPSVLTTGQTSGCLFRCRYSYIEGKGYSLSRA